MAYNEALSSRRHGALQVGGRDTGVNALEAESQALTQGPCADVDESTWGLLIPHSKCPQWRHAVQARPPARRRQPCCVGTASTGPPPSPRS